MSDKARIDFWQAEAVVNAVHSAWSEGDLDRLLSYYCPDIIYTCNGESGGLPVKLVGRDAMRQFLAPILVAAESVCVVDRFTFDGTVARTRVESSIKHRKTSFVLSGNFRQVMRFEGVQISHLDEFHDAAKLNAFWRLVAQSEQDLLQNPDSEA